MEHAARDGQESARRDHIDMVGLNRHPVRRQTNGHFGMAREQFGQKAFMGGVEVLDNEIGHAATGGQCAQKIAACLQPTGGSPDGDDRKVI